jgi:hypothetical protein
MAAIALQSGPNAIDFSDNRYESLYKQNPLRWSEKFIHEKIDLQF